MSAVPNIVRDFLHSINEVNSLEASMQILAHTNNEELIIATNDMALKYKVIYKAENSEMGNSLSSEQLTLENLKIIRLDLLPMTQKDFDYIKEAQ